MSRTREVDVWVSRSIIEEDNSIPNVIRREKYNEAGVKLNGKETLKAKLIIELPERKVTISESEFYEKTCDFFRTLSGPNSDIQIAKKWQEMFFKDTE